MWPELGELGPPVNVTQGSHALQRNPTPYRGTKAGLPRHGSVGFIRTGRVPKFSFLNIASGDASDRHPSDPNGGDHPSPTTRNGTR
jgi:hypothetical protein